MKPIEAQQIQKTRNPKRTQGITLIKLMLILIAVGIISTVVVHIIRHYTIH